MLLKIVLGTRAIIKFNLLNAFIFWIVNIFSIKFSACMVHNITYVAKLKKVSLVVCKIFVPKNCQFSSYFSLLHHILKMILSQLKTTFLWIIFLQVWYTPVRCLWSIFAENMKRFKPNLNSHEWLFLDIKIMKYLPQNHAIIQICNY